MNRDTATRMPHMGDGRTKALRRALAHAAAAAAIALSLVPAAAQSVDCNALRDQIAATPVQSDPRAVAAAQRQRAEIERTAAYADQLGCNRRQFLFFGSPPPPQCGQIEARLANMRGNLDRLQNAVDRGSAQRNALIARYNQLCTRQAAAPRNIFEQLFGVDRSGLNEGPVEEFPPTDESGPRRGSKAVCVRTCDGFFFPVSYNAFGQSSDRLSDLCQAQCPNADTEVFTYSPSSDITEAVSVNGQPYTSLANALKYRRSVDPACTCRPPGKSWAETLGPAERLVSSGRRDLIVTPEKAEEMSRPRQTPAPAPAPRSQNIAPAGRQQPDAATSPRAGAGVEERLAEDDLRRVRRVGPAL